VQRVLWQSDDGLQIWTRHARSTIYQVNSLNDTASFSVAGVSFEATKQEPGITFVSMDSAVKSESGLKENRLNGTSAQSEMHGRRRMFMADGISKHAEVVVKRHQAHWWFVRHR
jgi:hypothetical protein